jgi:hypothetical protein
MFKNTYFVVGMVIVLVLSACVPVTSPASTADPVPHPDAPIQNMTVTPIPGGTSTVTPQLEVIPMPHPEPPISGVEMYAIVNNAYIYFMQSQVSEIKSEEDFRRFTKQFMGTQLYVGATPMKVGDILGKLSPDDWKKIQETGEAMEDPNNWDDLTGGALAAALLVRGCHTSCREIFEIMWLAMAHFSSGEYWFTIADGFMSSHANTFLCGRSFDWEYLLEILEERCEQYGYRVSYEGATIRVTSGWHKKNGGVEYTFRIPEINQDVVIITAATVIVVGVIVIAASGGSAAPVLVPVLLVL